MLDYHIHTPLCNHAKGGMREVVRHAIDKKLTEICFLDHLILDGPGMKNSMDKNEIPFYINAISQLKHEFQEQITIRAGLEVDFVSKNIPDIIAITESYDFDVIGASVHFINGLNVASTRTPLPKDPDKQRDFALRYFEEIRKLVEYDFFDMICHPDVVKKSGLTIHKDCYPLIEDILDRISEKNVALEFNGGGWDHPACESYPSLWIAEKCHEKNIAFCPGSDAHRPENVGRNLDKVMEILEQIGYTHIRGFDRHQPKDVPLRGKSALFCHK